MNPPTESAAPLPYEDRKTGLVLFGILTILLGGICALFVPLMIYGQAMATTAGPALSQPSMLPAATVYGLLAVALVCLGVGSITGRRWARALMLIFAWTWLIMGLFSTAMMAITLPQITEATNAGGPAAPASTSAIMIISTILVGFIFVVIPVGYILFYRSRHVKATCEALDPVERWTDRSPLPIITLCVWLGFAVPMLLLTALTSRSVIPFFGDFVTGPVGTATYIFFAALWGYSAWSLYRLEWRGWWIVMFTMCVFAISALMTYTRHDVTELYRLMGYPEDQVALMRQFSFMKGQNLAMFSASGIIPFLGYLLYLRKFLRFS